MPYGHWLWNSRTNYKSLAEPRPQLKVTIPKDTTKPDGDAVENGALLSASELEKRGHFVNSPSDLQPIPAISQTEKDDDPEDKTYKPPKKSNALENEAPQAIFGSDGEEISSETEHGREVVSRLTSRRFLSSHGVF